MKRYFSMLLMVVTVAIGCEWDMDIDYEIRQLQHSRAERNEEAAKFLATKLKDERAFRAMTDVALKHENRKVRLIAVEALGKWGDERAIEPLLAVAMNDKEEDALRKITLRAIRSVGGQHAIKALIGVMSQDSNVFIRICAMDALEELEPGMLGWSAINRAWDPIVRQLIQIRLHWPKNEWEAQEEAEHILRERWNKARVVLLTDVYSKKKQLVEDAVYALIGMGDERALLELVKGLDRRGNKIMAETYLNCGNETLYDAAERWAWNHGYDVGRGDGAHKSVWGSWK